MKSIYTFNYIEKKANRPNVMLVIADDDNLAKLLFQQNLEAKDGWSLDIRDSFVMEKYSILKVMSKKLM